MSAGGATFQVLVLYRRWISEGRNLASATFSNTGQNFTDDACWLQRNPIRLPSSEGGTRTVSPGGAALMAASGLRTLIVMCPPAASFRPGQDERLDLPERPHALDGLVDLRERIAVGEHRLEVEAIARAANELERLPELADVGRLHAEDRRLLAHDERRLHRRQGPPELADDGVATARPQEVETFREGEGRAGQLEDDVGPGALGQLSHAREARLGGRQLLDRHHRARPPALCERQAWRGGADHDEVANSRVRGHRGREEAERTRALDHHALVGLDATDALEGVNDGPERAARRGGDPVRHAIGNAHAARGRKDVAVLREAAHEVGEALAVRAHVLLLTPAHRRHVLHAALVALPAVHVR